MNERLWFEIVILCEPEGQAVVGGEVGGRVVSSSIIIVFKTIASNAFIWSWFVITVSLKKNIIIYINNYKRSLN